MEGEGTESNCPLSANTDEKDEFALELSSERLEPTYQIDEWADSDLEVEEKGWKSDSDFSSEDEPLQYKPKNAPSARNAAGLADRAERKSSLPK